MSYILTQDSRRLAQISLTGLSESSLEIIHQQKQLLLPLVNQIVEELYEEIYKVGNLKGIIDKFSTINQLKEKQKEYLRQAFSPIIDDSYIQNRYITGKVHSRIGLDLPWYISTHRRYCQIISNHLAASLPMEQALSVLNAVHSLLNFDMQITVEAYNEIEVDKANFPLRYEFKHLQEKTGLTEEDFQTLDAYSGFLTFRLEEVLELYKNALSERGARSKTFSHQIDQYIPYLSGFVKQFFQEKIYREVAVFYRIICDWTRILVDQKISDHVLTSLIDIMNEVLRETFLTRDVKFEKGFFHF